MTTIVCNAKSCKHRIELEQYIEGKNGRCTKDTVILQPCACIADNVVACSEFEDKEGGGENDE